MAETEVKKHLFLIHGRNFKPEKKDLEGFWEDAITSGLQRDPPGRVPNYAKIEKTFVYYGDLSNDFLEASGKEYNQTKDTRDRQGCLAKLKGYKNKDDFLDKQGKKNYEKLKGSFIASLKERGARILGRKIGTIGIGGLVMGWYAKDVKYYWKRGTAFSRNVRNRLAQPLHKALISGDDIVLVSHSLGTVISYDVLWGFSYYEEYKGLRAKLENREQKPVTLITLGSPLGNMTMQKHLEGSNDKGKYPTLIKAWHNFSAIGDYISHDRKLADDYKGLGFEIKDCRIYNLAVRNGKSNPHHGTGYLIHPKFIEVLQEWC